MLKAFRCHLVVAKVALSQCFFSYHSDRNLHARDLNTGWKIAYLRVLLSAFPLNVPRNVLLPFCEYTHHIVYLCHLDKNRSDS